MARPRRENKRFLFLSNHIKTTMINPKNNRKTTPIVISKQTNRTNGRLRCNCRYSKLQRKQTKRMLASIQEIKKFYRSNNLTVNSSFTRNWSSCIDLTWSFRQDSVTVLPRLQRRFRSNWLHMMLSNQHHNQNHSCHWYRRSDDATLEFKKDYQDQKNQDQENQNQTLSSSSILVGSFSALILGRAGGSMGICSYQITSKRR